MDLKTVNDYENKIKDFFRELKIQKEQISTNIKSYKSAIQIIKNIPLLLTTILMTLTILMSHHFLLILDFVMIFISYFSIEYGNNLIFSLEEAENQIYTEMKEQLYAFDNIIDSCELLKNYLRGRDLTTKDLIKIVSFLYQEFGNNLESIVGEIASRSNCNLELVATKNISNIASDLEYNYCSKNLKKVLKR